MSELITKLIGLSYELFGVILPGLILSLFLLLTWVALGPAIPIFSLGAIPTFSMSNLNVFLDALSIASGISIIAPLLVIWYFLGHILLWISRSGPPLEPGQNTGIRRLGLTIVMRIPKPGDNFDPALAPLLSPVCAAFNLERDNAKWRILYPISKCYLSRALPTSLVSTYQNKYTFHRSVAAASAVLFWLSSLGTVGSALILYAGGPTPTWALLVTLLLASIAIAWGFSGSYQYHWQMFGNTIITETYSLLNSPDYVKPNGQ